MVLKITVEDVILLSKEKVDVARYNEGNHNKYTDITTL